MPTLALPSKPCLRPQGTGEPGEADPLRPSLGDGEPCEADALSLLLLRPQWRAFPEERRASAGEEEVAV